MKNYVPKNLLTLRLEKIREFNGPQIVMTALLYLEDTKIGLLTVSSFTMGDGDFAVFPYQDCSDVWNGYQQMHGKSVNTQLQALVTDARKPKSAAA